MIFYLPQPWLKPELRTGVNKGVLLYKAADDDVVVDADRCASSKFFTADAA